MDMELKIKDVAELLQVSEKTVYRWVNDHKIPSYKVNGQYRFRRNELDDWLQHSRQDSAMPAIAAERSSDEPVDLVKLLQHGGIFYKIAGDTATEVIINSMKLMPLPEHCHCGHITDLLLAREALAPTAIGDKLAIPHPRDPVFSDPNQERVGLFFLHRGVDFDSLDKQNVEILFIPLASNRRRHLQIIRQLSYLARKKDFLALLLQQPLREEIYSYIERYRTELEG